MAETKTHASHEHQHGAGCGHTAVQHEGHTDYLHEGHMHHQSGSGVEEHTISAGSQNPAACDSGHACSSHGTEHQHSAQCGHEQVPHGDHVDYLVQGHLHSQHGDHCDDHGRVATA